ncbi:MAG TPA: M50 family metallopeptidase [Acidimicrobiia bacterium]|nr:M50 family metallopeptidase [Acidimicrobiia bacterium]
MTEGASLSPEPSRPPVVAPWRQRGLVTGLVVGLALMAGLPTWNLESPVALVGTYVHESGHAIAATATGDRAAGIAVSRHLGGVTVVEDRDPSTASTVFTASAGFLGTATGAALALVALAFFRAGIAAWAALAGYFAVTGAAWVRPNSIATTAYPGEAWVTFWFVLGALLVCAAMALLASRPVRLVGFAAVALVLAMATLGEFRLLGAGAGASSDLDQLARETGLPRALWQAVWSVVAIALVVGGAVVFARARSAGPDTQDHELSPPGA